MLIISLQEDYEMLKNVKESEDKIIKGIDKNLKTEVKFHLEAVEF